jgi:DUF1680 family protein
MTLVMALTPVLSGVAALAQGPPAQDYPITPVKFNKVRVNGGFWGPRLETNRTATLPANWRKCEETGRIENFEKAAKLKPGRHKGIFFDDSDVYKVCEGAAYTLALQPDPALDKYLEDLVALFAKAQEPDGYLYTARTIDPEHPANCGKERWANLKDAHEMYCMGHMIEAAVAHYEATGRRTFLDVAIKCGDLLDRTFGPGKTYGICGHPEIELALAKLYRATGDVRYLNLAKFFVDQHGNGEHREIWGPYYSDEKPLLQMDEVVGHAVRAGYFYSGAADVAALTGSPEYITAIDRLWENMVSRKMYITGGIGAKREGEAFGANYELPNQSAYCETCAAIANAFWNHRMFLLHGDGKYMDVFERVIYNGFLAGLSMEGDTFFYPNPLIADGVFPFNHGSRLRQPWFGCSCCPTNDVRFIPSLPGAAYAVEKDRIYVSLYLNGEAEMDAAFGTVRIAQETRYPWDGAVALTVTPDRAGTFELRLRIPGWAQGNPVPSDLYRYLDAAAEPPVLSVNGTPTPVLVDKGYAVVRREWKAGDRVELALAMPVRRVLANETVEDDRARVALERGPVVFCAEGIDNGGRALALYLPNDAALATEFRGDLLNGVQVIMGTARAVKRGEDNGVTDVEQPLLAVPYYAWAHRGVGDMAVWMAATAGEAKPAPPATLMSKSAATASYVNPNDSVMALSDSQKPRSSADESISRFTWWDHKGGTEWVQYDFPGETTVSGCGVYWFDDGPNGGCRVPAKWRVQYKDGDNWRKVEKDGEYAVNKGCVNDVSFKPVKTAALRIEVRLQEGFSGGILEWTVKEVK